MGQYAGYVAIMHSSNFFGLCWYSYRCLTQISLDQVGEEAMLSQSNFLVSVIIKQQMHIVQTLLVILLVIAINANNQISLVHAGFKHLMFGKFPQSAGYQATNAYYSNFWFSSWTKAA
jgi:hypothetical protein